MKYLSLLFIFIFIQCQQHNDKIEICDKKIKINPNSAKTLKYSEIFQECDIIPLYKDKNNIITRPDKIEIKDSIIYFANNKNLYGYDLNGNCKIKINKQGNGPGEYLSIADFIINDKIEINDRDGRKLFIYDFNGNHMGNFNHNLYSYTFIKKDNKYYFNSGCLYNDETNNNCRVNIFNEKNKVIKQSYFEIDKYEREINIIEYSNFALFDDTISFSYCLSDDIYCINKENLIKRLHIDFGNYSLPETFIKEHNDLNIFMEEIKKVKYATLIDGYKESSNYLFFSYAFNGKRIFTLYNKKKDKIHNFNEFEDDIFMPEINFQTKYSELPLLLTNNSLYRIIEANIFLEKIEELKKKKSLVEWNKYLRENPKIDKIYSEISPEDNHILIKYKFKEI